MKLFRVFAAAALTVSLASLAGSGYLYNQLQQKTKLLQDADARIVQLEERNALLEVEAAKLPPLQKESDRLRAQIKDYVTQRDQVKKELDAAFSKITDLNKLLRDLGAEKERIAGELKEVLAKNETVALEAARLPAIPGMERVAVPLLAVSTAKPVPSLIPNVSTPTVIATAVPAGAKPLREEIKKVDKKAEKKKKKEEEKKRKASLPNPRPSVPEVPTPSAAPASTAPAPVIPEPAVSTPPPPAPAAVASPLPTITTDQRPLQVLSVNRQFKFVVINAGMRSKLKLGDTLRVEQDGKRVGKIQIEKLYENFSACAIVEEIAPAQIREGDLVRIA